MHIKILGSGCKKCLALEENVKSAVLSAGLDADIEKVTDMIDIARYGIMSTPGLVIDEHVISTGKILTIEQIQKHLTNSK